MPTKEAKTTQKRIPLTITSNGITLRQYTLDDAAEAFSLIERNRDHLSKFWDNTSRKYQTLDSFEDSVRNPKNPDKLRFGIWDDKGTLVGSINLTPDPDNPSKGEIGYYLGSEFQRQGYMKRAVQTLTDYSFNSLNYEELYAKVVVGNFASIRVLEGIGFQKGGNTSIAVQPSQDMEASIWHLHK